MLVLTTADGKYSCVHTSNLAKTYESGKVYTLDLNFSDFSDFSSNTLIERTALAAGEIIEINLDSVINIDDIKWDIEGVKVRQKGDQESTIYDFVVPLNINHIATWSLTDIGTDENTLKVSTEDEPDAIPAFVSTIHKFTATIGDIIVEITQDGGTPVEYYGRYGSPLPIDEQVGKNRGYTRKRAIVTNIDVRAEWASDSYPTLGTKDKWNGLVNTNLLVEATDRIYPAAKYCADLGAGWYLPAQNQLAGAWVARSGLTTAFPSKDGNYYYWSSTEYGNSESIAFNFRIGDMDRLSRRNNEYVHCIRDL